jgi:membrane-associated protease RseP (regulator of RpoE activity)
MHMRLMNAAPALPPHRFARCAPPPPRRAGATGGLVVKSVAEGSPAALAGLVVNDILLTMNGQPLGTLEDLQRALTGSLGGAVPGDTVQVKTMRKSETRVVPLQIGARELNYEEILAIRRLRAVHADDVRRVTALLLDGSRGIGALVQQRMLAKQAEKGEAMTAAAALSPKKRKPKSKK